MQTLHSCPSHIASVHKSHDVIHQWLGSVASGNTSKLGLEGSPARGYNVAQCDRALQQLNTLWHCWYFRGTCCSKLCFTVVWCLMCHYYTLILFSPATLLVCQSANKSKYESDGALSLQDDCFKFASLLQQLHNKGQIAI